MKQFVSLLYNKAIAFILFQIATTSCPPQYQLIPVQYSVQFPSDDCQPAAGSDPPGSSPITIAVPAGSTAVDVMAGAADIDRRYRFQATSFGRTLGFFINAIGGTSSSSTCYWSFLVKEGSAPASPSNVGVSSYSICSEVSIILSYTFTGHNDAACADSSCT